MKVLLINGSPNEKGCTYTALAEVAASLNKEGIETEIFHGADASEENVAAAAEKVEEAGGLVVGAPVYWASPAGECVLFMDKLAGKAGEYLAHKPAAAVTSARRSGTVSTLDVLYKYFLYYQMPIVSAFNWTMVHGNTPEEVEKDVEGLQIMRVLGQNMAWLLKSIDLGRKAGLKEPVLEEERLWTNFIR